MAFKFTKDSQFTPNLSQQPEQIPLHSPLEIAGAFIFLLRDFFSQPHPRNLWQWTNNRNTTPIIIESGGEEDVALADAKPAIFVNIGQTVYEQISVGDLDWDQPNILEKGLKHFIAYGKTQLSVENVSPSHGESALIGDAVQQFLQMSSDEIQKYFNFHSMSPVILNATQPFEIDTKFFNTPCMFQVNFEVRWATIPIAPSLKNLKLKLQESGDPNNFFTNIVTKQQ